MNLTIFISYGDSTDVTLMGQFEKQKVFVRNIEIVKRPDNTILASFVRLYLGNNAVKKAFASGVYFNPMKGTFEIFSGFPHGEFGGVRKFVGDVLIDCAAPRKIQGAVQVVDSVPNNKGQIRENFFRFWELVYQGLSGSVWVLLDCSATSIFQRDNNVLQIRDMFILHTLGGRL